MAFQWASAAAQRGEDAARIKAWVRRMLQAGDELAISVGEFDCPVDACCGGVETIIALFWPDRSERVRIPAPMALVGPIEIELALWSLRPPP